MACNSFTKILGIIIIKLEHVTNYTEIAKFQLFQTNLLLQKSSHDQIIVQ